MEGWVGTAFAIVVFGGTLGIVARIFLPGRQHVGILLTILVGIVAAFLGQFIAVQFGLVEPARVDWTRLGFFSRGDVEWARLAIQVGVAMAAIAGLSVVAGDRR